MTVDPTTINIPQLINAILVLVGIIGTAFGAHGLSVKNKGKTIISALSDALSNVASAATNENVTETQFQAIVADATTIHNAFLPDKVIPAPAQKVTTSPASIVKPTS